MTFNLSTFVFAAVTMAATSVVADGLPSRSLKDDITIQVHTQNGDETIKISSSNNYVIPTWEFCFSCNPPGSECAATEDPIYIQWFSYDDEGVKIFLDDYTFTDGCENMNCAYLTTGYYVDSVSVQILGSDVMLLDFAFLTVDDHIENNWGDWDGEGYAWCLSDDEDDIEKMDSDVCDQNMVYDEACYEAIEFDNFEVVPLRK